MGTRTILHSDINCCYASIELLHHPELRGKPVAVGGDPEARHGIVLTADYVAKKCGVKTGMALWQAKQVCPDINFVSPRMDLYLRFSRMAHEIYSEYTDKQEPYGIDESWLDVTDSASIKGDGYRIATEISNRMKSELGITFIYVTHDQEEALTMSDKIVVMNQGYIQQIGSPEDIYNEPENAFVADFIGESNILEGIMLEDKLVSILGVKVPCVDVGFGTHKPVDVVIRPEDVELKEPGQGFMDGTITGCVFKGVHYEYDVMCGDYEWLVHTTEYFPVGKKVSLNVIPFNIQIMNKPESEDEEAMKEDE